MSDFVLLLPELFLAVTLAFVILGEISYHGERRRLITAISLIGLLGALLQTVLSYRYGAIQGFEGAISLDGFALFFKLLFLVLGAVSVVTVSQSSEVATERRSEYCAFVLASVLAMSLAATAANLLLIFIALQVVNILSFFLSGWRKNSGASVEAAIKHLIYSAVSGTFFLYGSGLLFGFAGSLNIYEIHRALLISPLQAGTQLTVFLLLLISLCFQIAAFPMHFWAPDVLEGAPTPASGFIAFGQRAVGFAVAIRLFTILFSQPSDVLGQWQVLGSLEWPRVLAVVAGFSMAMGALLSQGQQSAKRLVSALVVAQNGFLLLGLLVMEEVGYAALLFNLVIELFCLLGIFFVLSYFRDVLGSDRLSSFRGILGRAVPESTALLLFLICLVGAPPFPGYFGKFVLIGAAVRHDWNFLAAIAVLTLIVSSFSVARLAFSLIGDPKNLVPGIVQPLPPNKSRQTVLLALALPLILVGIFSHLVLLLAGQSLRFILW